jgi:Bacterial Ig domain
VRRSLACLALVLLVAGFGVRASGADFTGASSSPGNAFAAAADFNTVAVSVADPGAVLRRSVSLAATASSERGIATVRYQTSPAGAGTWTDACVASAAPWSCAWDTTAVTDGLRDLRAVATDGAGYERTSAVIASRRVDNTLPSVSLSDPGVLTGSKTLSATASDAGSGLASLAIDYRLADSGGAWTNVCTGATSPRSCVLNSGLLADGSYELRARATDAAGNVDDSALTRLADNTAPSSATLANPGASLSGNVALTGTAADAGSGVAAWTVQYRTSGGGTWTDACSDTAAPYGCTWATAGVADGLYDLRAVARDGAGNTTTSAIVSSVRVDNVAPTVALADPGTPITNTVTLSATASDGGGIASVVFERAPAGGSTWTTICTDTVAPYSCDFDTTAIAEVGYDLRARATDNAGRTATSVVAGRVVNHAPYATDVQATNGGLTAGRLESGDVLRLTYSEAMAPGSILSGWTGAAQAIRVDVTDGGTVDTMDFRNSAGTTRLNLTNSAADLSLGANFVNSAAVLNATMSMSGSVVTITLGSLSSGAVRIAAAAAANMTWRPSSLSTDLAGIPALTTPVTEPGTIDRDF